MTVSERVVIPEIRELLEESSMIMLSYYSVGFNWSRHDSKQSLWHIQSFFQAHSLFSFKFSFIYFYIIVFSENIFIIYC